MSRASSTGLVVAYASRTRRAALNNRAALLLARAVPILLNDALSKVVSDLPERNFWLPGAYRV
jgi:hypothetical protein